MVRAHNEVMQVIGVAEADNNAVAEAEMHREHYSYEDAKGQLLLRLGFIVQKLELDVWGLAGIRQRIMVCALASSQTCVATKCTYRYLRSTHIFLWWTSFDTRECSARCQICFLRACRRISAGSDCKG